MFSFR